MHAAPIKDYAVLVKCRVKKGRKIENSQKVIKPCVWEVTFDAEFKNEGSFAKKINFDPD